MTGASFASLQKGGKDAAVAPEDEARPEDHVLKAGRLHVELLLPLRAVVGNEILGLLGRPERAHQDETLGSGACGEQVSRALDHDPLELLGLALPDRDEVDDDVLARRGPAQAVGVRHISLSRLLAAEPGLPPGTGLALQHPHLVARIDNRVRDRRSDEPRRAGDEHFHRTRSRKFS